MPCARSTVLSIIGALAMAVAGCASDGPNDAQSSGAATSGSSLSGDITVFAAASLAAAYEDIGAAFHRQHPGAEVRFNFAASSRLVADLNGGAEADVFASADQANMAKLTVAGNAAAAPRLFASNSLQIVVGAGNPEHITGVADLARSGLVVVTCAPEVPIGAYTRQVLTKAGVAVTPASLETDVRGVVTKVMLGEADAGIVYATDVIAAGPKVAGIEIPARLNAVATYPIAVTTAAREPAIATAFVDFVTGPQGQAILRQHGFSPP